MTSSHGGDFARVDDLIVCGVIICTHGFKGLLEGGIRSR